MNKNDILELKILALETIKALETPQGILASGKNELFGCIFGRDSLITALKLLEAYRYEPDQYYLSLVKKILMNLAILQGAETNIESGEEPGKIIHEYRADKHEHLTVHGEKPWFTYLDGTMRNYDSVDSTPLFLIAAYRYWQKSHDNDFINIHLPHIKKALLWLLEYGDSNNDGLVDYHLPAERSFGGLISQSWMDSHESLFYEDKTMAAFPVTPAEAQGYSYLSLRLWADYFKMAGPEFCGRLNSFADHLKTAFADKFILNKNERIIFVPTIGDTRPMEMTRSNIGHLLWSSMNKADDGRVDSILSEEHIPALVMRIFEADMYDPRAGIRTLSRLSANFDPRGYHNGSIWPHDNSIIAEGLDNHSYHKEGHELRQAILNSFCHFRAPIELFVFENDAYDDYVSGSGQKACRQQAWSAAAMLSDTLKEINFEIK